MKKLVLTTVCTLAVAGAAFAQGSLNWSVISPAAMTAVTNNVLYSPLVGGGSAGGAAIGAAGGSAGLGTGFYWALLYSDTFTGSQVSGANAPSNSAAALFGGTWLDSGLAASNSATAGRLGPVAGNAGAVVPWSPGHTDNIVMVGWSANLGSSWGVVSNIIANWSSFQIANSFFGVSAAGYLTPLASSVSPGNTVFATAATTAGLPIFSLNTTLYALPVPEPTTFVLAGLGGLSLILFRRRK